MRLIRSFLVFAVRHYGRIDASDRTNTDPTVRPEVSSMESWWTNNCAGNRLWMWRDWTASRSGSCRHLPGPLAGGPLSLQCTPFIRSVPGASAVVVLQPLAQPHNIVCRINDHRDNLPAHAGGTVDIRVTNTSGRRDRAADQFTYSTCSFDGPVPMRAIAHT